MTARAATVTRIAGGALVGISLPNAFTEALIHITEDQGVAAAYGWCKVAVLLAGVLGLWRIVRAPHRAFGWLVAWAAGVAMLAGVAPVVFGGAPVMPTGLLSFGGASLGLGAGLAWWRRVMRHPTLLAMRQPGGGAPPLPDADRTRPLEARGQAADRM